MTSGPLTEKLPLRDVDFGVAFEKECAAFSYGKGKFIAHVFSSLAGTVPYVKSFF
jgi:hypothetical protein